MISFSCGSCKKQLKVKDELAGKKVKCPGCGQPVAVPALAAAPARQEERTLPPKVSAGGEERTLPPKNLGQAGTESLSDSDEQTNLGAGGGRGQVTQTLPAEGPSPQLYDFLAPAEKPDEIGRLGPYRVLKVLGAGGMGVVFRAEDPHLERLVALKAMLPSMASSPGAKERFFREAKAAAALKHPHIVGIYYVGEDRGAPFLAMEYLEGEPLDERLKRETKLPVPEILRIGREIAKGLAAAHEKGLIHRDIKPANIWLEGKEGHVKILDFGLARAMGDTTHLTQSGAIIGTPAYMAPEQAGGKQVDCRCDLFSLGCVLYCMCTGERPFKGNDTMSILSALLMDTPLPPVSMNLDVPTELSDLVMHLLAKKPEDRPESAKVVAETLQEIEDQTAETTPAPGRKTGKVKGSATKQMEAARTQGGKSAKRRLPLPWLVGGVLGLGAVAAAIILFWQTPNGTVRIESDDPNVEIVFDKNGPTIKGTDKEPITLRAGEHGILIKRGDFSFEADKFVLKKGQTIALKLEWLPSKVQVVQDGKVISSHAVPPPPTFTNSIGIEFVLVPKGKSWLGGGGGKPGDKEVEFKEDFYLGKYELTQEEWEKVMGRNPSLFCRTASGTDTVKSIADADLKRFPVECVSWTDAQEFLQRVNAQVEEAGWVYRLPKEAEWEYACRGGPMADKSESAFDFYFDKPTNQLLATQANFQDSGLKRTCKVGSYPPNRLGLYDMHGNVAEWSEEADRQSRVTRGGRWGGSADICRAAQSSPRSPLAHGSNLGFRVARVPVGKDIVAKPPEKKTEAPTPPNPFTNSIGMKFVWIPPGSFMMGSSKEEKGRDDKETQHKVTLTKGFYMSVYTVTQEEWQAVMGNNPSHFKGEMNLPVEKVSWEDCQEFVKKLREKDKKAYRLPSESEWEFACRAGTTTPFFFGEAIFTDQANYNGDHIYGTGKKGVNRAKTTPVGSFPSNAFGLHDMSGNIWQWCQDWYGDYPQKEVVDPQVPEKGNERVLRGGSWDDNPECCRSAHRSRREPGNRVNFLGCRVCFSMEEDGIQPPKKDPPKQTEAPTPPKTFTNSIGMEFVLVPKGKSWLGGGGGKPSDKEVEIAQDFYLGKYEVTQEEWEKVTGNKRSHFSRTGPGKDAVKDIPDADLKRFPVETVSREDTQLFLELLNNKEKEVGWMYRLPKEAEWEYACRGGPMAVRFESAFDYYFDKPTNQLQPEQANSNAILKRTCKVGSYRPNSLGLYDMHGNVCEWCDDLNDTKDPLYASFRVSRGGGWGDASVGCRAMHRNMYPPSFEFFNLGLRLARVPVGKEVIAKPPEKKTEAPMPPKTFTNSLGMKFVWIPPGSFMMGSPKEETGRQADGGGDETQHKVTLTKGFYIGVYTVTQEEWQALMGNNPSYFKGKKNLPVEQVSWDDCQEFIKKLRAKDKKAYRLPTEAEWEYSCRAGTTTPFFFGDTISTDQANYNGDGTYGNGKKGKKRDETMPVGSFPANAWGLYDMHGNVGQWCQDWVGDYPQHDVVDPQGPEKDHHRAARGGSFFHNPEKCRSAYRIWNESGFHYHCIGLRVCFFVDK